MKKILLIDDSKVIINLLKIKIDEYFSEDIDILVALTYKEATKLIGEYSSDIGVAIVDMNLPDTKEGKAVVLTNSHNIPTIIFSGDEQSTMHSKLMQLHSVLDFISKNSTNSIDYAVGFANRMLRNSLYTALVVDDSKLYREKFRKDLERLKLNVLTAQDGQEAYELMKQMDKDKVVIVLTDYNMPKMDGIELVSKLRQEYKRDALSILAISSNDDMKTLTRFIKAGADDYIHKPYSLDELIVRVGSNLNTVELFKKSKDLANKDFLTGAYNRRYFFEISSSVIAKNYRKEQPIAIATIDIDKFKLINDKYGHDIGDIAIKEVIKVVHSCIRASDIFARFGGEEFCLLIEDISLENMKRLFEKIRVAFENNRVVIDDDVTIKYTVSIGVAYRVSKDINQMLKISDEALYEAKESGRNRVVIHS
ncbi:MAG: diguanylate cyclase [Campylobacterota bacterium]|nr:diguanylate cyclase [Campylobacterota bacterium]